MPESTTSGTTSGESAPPTDSSDTTSSDSPDPGTEGCQVIEPNELLFRDLRGESVRSQRYFYVQQNLGLGTDSLDQVMIELWPNQFGDFMLSPTLVSSYGDCSTCIRVFQDVGEEPLGAGPSNGAEIQYFQTSGRATVTASDMAHNGVSIDFDNVRLVESTVQPASGQIVPVEDGACLAIADGVYVTPECGNGLVEGTEACDDEDFNGRTCENIGYTDGQLTCATCAIEIETCNFVATGYEESFEAETIPSPWISLGDGEWQTTDSQAFDGDQSVFVGGLGNEQSATLERSLQFPEGGSMRFSVRTSTEAGFDVLEFIVNRQIVLRWTGETDWSEGIVTLPAGTHTFAWRYRKDRSGSDGEDSVWVDHIQTIGGS